MPIKGFRLRVKANNSLLKSSFRITYLNDSDEKIEATLQMATNFDMVIHKLLVIIGDQRIKGQVTEKERARETYEDAISRGN